MTKILVAEDDSLVQHMAVTALAEHGHQFVRADSGARAMQLLASEAAPRVLLVSWTLAGTTGPNLIRWVRRSIKLWYPYVIAMITKPSRMETLAALDCGADDYVPKPFHEDELLARIDTGMRIVAVETRVSRMNGEWRAMLDYLPYGVACLERDGTLHRGNRAFFRLFGYETAGRLLGKNIAQMLFGDDTEWILRFRRLETFENLRLPVRACNGRVRQVIFSGKPVELSGERLFQIIATVDGTSEG